jgi:hypothetical protein
VPPCGDVVLAGDAHGRVRIEERSESDVHEGESPGQERGAAEHVAGLARAEGDGDVGGDGVGRDGPGVDVHSGWHVDGHDHVGVDLRELVDGAAGQAGPAADAEDAVDEQVAVDGRDRDEAAARAGQCRCGGGMDAGAHDGDGEDAGAAPGEAGRREEGVAAVVAGSGEHDHGGAVDTGARAGSGAVAPLAVPLLQQPGALGGESGGGALHERSWWELGHQLGFRAAYCRS